MIKIVLEHDGKQLPIFYDEENKKYQIHANSEVIAKIFFPLINFPTFAADAKNDDKWAVFPYLSLDGTLRDTITFQALKQKPGSNKFEVPLSESEENAIRTVLGLSPIKSLVSHEDDRKRRDDTQHAAHAGGMQRNDEQDSLLDGASSHQQPLPTQPNWFAKFLLRFKGAWDRLPTWGKWVLGITLVLGTLVGFGAITFGTAGLIAPAAAASILVGLHLAAAGVSVPLAASIAALVGGVIAATLFGVLPGASAIAGKVIEPTRAPLLRPLDGPSCAGFFTGLLTASTCGKYQEDNTRHAALRDPHAKKPWCDYSKKDDEDENESCWQATKDKYRSCAPEFMGGDEAPKQKAL